jgi:hypothetical protein
MKTCLPTITRQVTFELWRSASILSAFCSRKWTNFSDKASVVTVTLLTHVLIVHAAGRIIFMEQAVLTPEHRPTDYFGAQFWRDIQERVARIS